MVRAIYICDKKKCEDCSYPICKFTTDIEHQLKIEDSYVGSNLDDRLYYAAEDALNGIIHTELLAELLLDARNALICVTNSLQQSNNSQHSSEKVGHWEWVPFGYPSVLGNWVCSKCKSVVVEAVNKKNKHDIPAYKFCPQCGDPKMEVQNET